METNVDQEKVRPSPPDPHLGSSDANTCGSDGAIPRAVPPGSVNNGCTAADARSPSMPGGCSVGADSKADHTDQVSGSDVSHALNGDQPKGLDTTRTGNGSHADRPDTSLASVDVRPVDTKGSVHEDRGEIVQGDDACSFGKQSGRLDEVLRESLLVASSASDSGPQARSTPKRPRTE